jgi:predicted O-methyltransferase YrrM
MKIASPKLAAAAAVLGLVLAAGIVFAATDHLGAALVCVLLVQGAGIAAIADTRRLQGGVAAASSTNAKALAHVNRGLTNVSARVVTETSAVQKDLAAHLRKTHAAIDRRADFRLQDVEAMFQLFSRFNVRAAMPPSGRWALEPAGLLRIVDLIATRPIQTIVELGSGTSTLWSSYALEKRGAGGRIVSLDHDPHFAAITRAMLATHGFAHGPAEVRDAPLTADVLAGHPSAWYDPAAIEGVDSIDLLVVDGPPKSSGELARYPALPVLLSRLAPGAIIVVDDAARPEETAIVQRWMAEVPGLRRLDIAGEGRQILLTLGA